MNNTSPTPPAAGISMADIPAAVRQVLGESLGYVYPAALRVALRLGVPDQLAAGPRTAAQLAEHAGADGPTLYRVLRFLATRGIFREDEAGTFSLTPAAQVLRTDVPYSVAATALMFTEEIHWRSTGNLEDTVRKGSTAFNDLFGAPLFDYLTEHPDSARIFHNGVTALSTIEQGGIADACEFPEQAKVIDVGGGTGGFLRTLLTKNPGLTGVLFEQKSALERHQLDDPALAGRWEIADGDFLTAVPDGGDVYILKRVLHDWDDEHCLRILRAVRQSMTEDTRLLVIDAVVPTDNEPHASKLYDVAMMTVFDGKERTEPEFVELLTAADLKLLRVTQTPGTVAVLEVSIA